MRLEDTIGISKRRWKNQSELMSMPQSIQSAAWQIPSQLEGKINEQLFSLLKQWKYCDLILDRALSDPLKKEVAELPVDQPVLPINPARIAAPVGQCLLLARLTVKELSILGRSIEISLKQNTNPAQPVRSIGGWLFSTNTSPEELVRHLERSIIVRISQSPDALLRIWDSRVIGHMQRILTKEQMTTLLGPIDCWAWIDRNGSLQLLKNQLASAAKPKHAALPLLLSEEQDAAIDRIQTINLLLKTLANLGHIIPTSRDIELDHILMTGQHKGHVNPADLLAYGLHALLISKTFDAVPAVSHAIHQAHIKGLGLCAALEQFGDDFWEPHKNHRQQSIFPEKENQQPAYPDEASRD